MEYGKHNIKKVLPYNYTTHKMNYSKFVNPYDQIRENIKAMKFSSFKSTFNLDPSYLRNKYAVYNCTDDGTQHFIYEDPNVPGKRYFGYYYLGNDIRTARINRWKEE